MKIASRCTVSVWLALLLGLCTSCTDCQKHPQDCVKVPVSDATPPAVALTAFSSKPQITVTDTSGPITASVTNGDRVVLWGNCTDPDGGCKNIQIWVERTTWKHYANGTTSQAGPGLLGGPEAESPDTVSKIGDQARKQRTVSLDVEDFKSVPANTSIRLRAWAEAYNFSGTKSTSKDLVLNFP